MALDINKLGNFWENKPSDTPINETNLNKLNSKIDEIIDVAGSGGSGGGVPIGTVAYWALENNIPNGWFEFNGQSLLKEDYPTASSLFPEDPNDSTKFVLTSVPGTNPSGKVFVSRYLSDTDFSLVGNFGGVKSITLETKNLPSHTHPVVPKYQGVNTDASNIGASSLPARNTLVSDNSPKTGYALSTGATGEGAPFNNLSPYYVVIPIVKIFDTDGTETSVNIVGSLNDLKTTNKTNTVNAINELYDTKSNGVVQSVWGLNVLPGGNIEIGSKQNIKQVVVYYQKTSSGYISSCILPINNINNANSWHYDEQIYPTNPIVIYIKLKLAENGDTVLISMSPSSTNTTIYGYDIIN